MEYEISSSNKFKLGLRELIEYRELFYFFTWRDIKIKYKQAILGFAWALLQPLFMALIFSVFLGELITNKTQLSIPYPVFVVSGIVLWNVFSTGLSGAANSMVTNSHIIKKIYFPRLIIPISSILVSVFDFLMSLLILIPFVLYYNTSINPLAFVYIPLSVLITALSCIGLGTLLSALNIKYRDFKYIIPFFIQVLFFLTPVIYPSGLTENAFFKILIALNPMTAAIEIFRASFTSDFTFSTKYLVSTFSAVFFFVIGIWYFRKTENYFADVA